MWGCSTPSSVGMDDLLEDALNAMQRVVVSLGEKYVNQQIFED